MSISVAKAGFFQDFAEKEEDFLQQDTYRNFKNIINELSGFTLGDFVVHEDHGISRFLGIESIKIKNQLHDCAKLEFSNAEYLYTPVENIDAIKRFGDNADVPQLDKLGGVAFAGRKASLDKKILDIARDILDIAARRAVIQVPKILVDLAQYQKFADAFPYTLTKDQQRAVNDIISDLASGRPTDRLICGDVGFGKTEVAMRAAFLASKNNQHKPALVAIICPTTILARQHYNNFCERFAGFNVKIAELSRLVDVKTQKIVKAELCSNDCNIDIVVGTHALLSKNVILKNLSLLVIDEEQHFGVAQKEALKEIKSHLHVISLSATPIPRSLQMSFIGLKSFSLITTPPVNRRPIQTSLLHFDENVIKHALLNEKLRNGQSFYVVPRIEYIASSLLMLERIAPQLKIGIIHGSINAEEIDAVLVKFYSGGLDVLLCTAIIESGINIKAANTIIIANAEMFGLSQIYQLRGRIGRDDMQGYAYIMTSQNKQISDIARDKLEIITKIDQFGGGFVVANHDMETRGFGNIVGKKQSGHIKDIGIELYQDMLDEAIRDMKNTALSDGHVQPHINPTINLGLPIYISRQYIENDSTRFGLYKRIGMLRNNTEILELMNDVEERFGPMTQELRNLFGTVQIKILCRSLKIVAIDAGSGGIILRFTYDCSDDKIKYLASQYNKNAIVKPNKRFAIVQKFSTDEAVIGEVISVLERLNKIIVTIQ